MQKHISCRRQLRWRESINRSSIYTLCIPLCQRKKRKKTKRSETPRLFWGDCSVVLKNPSSRVWLISLSALTAVRLQQMGWQSASWHNASLRKFLETDWERSWGVKVWWYDMIPNNMQRRGHASWPHVQFFRQRCRSVVKSACRWCFIQHLTLIPFAFRFFLWDMVTSSAVPSTWLRR